MPRLYGRVIFGLLAAVALTKLIGAREPAVTMGHIAALWIVCWLGAKLSERAWFWLPLGLIAFAFAWIKLPVIPVVILLVLDRVTRPKPSKSAEILP